MSAATAQESPVRESRSENPIWLRYLALGLVIVAAATLVGFFQRELKRTRRYAIPSETAAFHTLTGETDTIPLLARETALVLFALDASCAHCDDAVPTWKEVLGRLRKPGGEPSSEVLFVAFNYLEPADAFLIDHGFDNSLLRRIPPEFGELLGIDMLPATVVVPAKQEEVFVWRGVLTARGIEWVVDLADPGVGQ